MDWVVPITLQGQCITLVPLLMEHCKDLTEAVQDGELWKLWYTNVSTPENMEFEIKRRLNLKNDGSMLPFAVIDNQTGKSIGMTSYMNINTVDCRLEIGSTWYSKSFQKTACNTECKFMLLIHAFETLNCIAVEFRTNFFNQQSKRAIERLGAKLDGILRNHVMAKNGVLRDTCVYSIINNEWPAVKANLQWKLGGYS